MPRTLRSVLFMATVCAVCTAVPAMVRAATSRRVEALERLATYRNVLSILAIPVDHGHPAAVESVFIACVREQVIGGRTFWFGLEAPAVGVVAFAVRGPGFWGPIHGIVAVSENDHRIVGILFTRHEETPGLGGRIREPWFGEQFHGITLDPHRQGPLVRLIRQGSREHAWDVDAITGATETSKKIQSLFDSDVRQALLTLSEAGRS
ncbi:FMN-binding protein [Candidatus Fermentibacteria bacterium]|nr:FMN-binding protein [Candidatus Fermentibacteria bacterium]